jgi:hypothetical protein
MLNEKRLNWWQRVLAILFILIMIILITRGLGILDDDCYVLERFDQFEFVYPMDEYLIEKEDCLVYKGFNKHIYFNNCSDELNICYVRGNRW